MQIHDSICEEKKALAALAVFRATLPEQKTAAS
jgi:hypothetical protein